MMQKTDMSFSTRHFHNIVNFVFPCICSFLYNWNLKILVDVKLDVSWSKGLPLKVAYFIGLLDFEWHRQNTVGNMGIIHFIVLWRDREKLY